MKLRDDVAVVIVTHNLQQAFRVADYVGFMYLGDLVEYASADDRLRGSAAAAHEGVRERCVRLAPISRSARGRRGALLVLRAERLRHDPGRRPRGSRSSSERTIASREPVEVRRAPTRVEVERRGACSAAAVDGRRGELRNTGDEPVNDLPMLVGVRAADGARAYLNDGRDLRLLPDSHLAGDRAPASATHGSITGKDDEVPERRRVRRGRRAASPPLTAAASLPDGRGRRGRAPRTATRRRCGSRSPTELGFPNTTCRSSPGRPKDGRTWPPAGPRPATSSRARRSP